MGSLILFACKRSYFLEKLASAEGASRQIRLSHLKSLDPINNFWIITFLTTKFTLASLASNFKFTLANRKFHSPWRVWRVLFPPLQLVKYFLKSTRINNLSFITWSNAIFLTTATFGAPLTALSRNKYHIRKVGPWE